MTDEQLWKDQMSLSRRIPSGVWVNKKTRKLYHVRGYGKHSETMEDMVAYENTYGVTFFRPAVLFEEKFERLTEQTR